jgi:amidohydrolase
MDKNKLKKLVCDEIDNNSKEIIEIGNDIFNHPELGFKENRTASIVEKSFEKLGLNYKKEIAITGLKANAKGKNSKANIMVMGELDAVISPLHPNADKDTGASHSCGHNAQIASMLGVAIGLVPFMKYLDGDVTFAAVPSEEFVEFEYRKQLFDQGKIVFFGGKQEWIRLGEFDDIDMGMMCHSHAGIEDRKFLINCDSSGFYGKKVNFIGKEAHAGAEPFNGINALNTASLAIMAINSLRETFKEEDRVRVHPIITKGGDIVNTVPSDVRMEMYVRAKTINAVKESNDKVNRAIIGSAYAMGAKADIDDIPGYLPLIQDKDINELFAKNSEDIMDENANLYGYELMGATDAGDVSSIMPFAHLSSGGFSGVAHSKSFEICDPYMAYVMPAKTMAMTVIDLLWDDAMMAKEIKNKFKPSFTKESYMQFWENMKITDKLDN